MGSVPQNVCIRTLRHIMVTKTEHYAHVQLDPGKQTNPETRNSGAGNSNTSNSCRPLKKKSCNASQKCIDLTSNNEVAASRPSDPLTPSQFTTAVPSI